MLMPDSPVDLNATQCSHGFRDEMRQRPCDLVGGLGDGALPTGDGCLGKAYLCARSPPLAEPARRP
jgi:hypothetical protein